MLRYSNQGKCAASRQDSSEEKPVRGSVAKKGRNGKPEQVNAGKDQQNGSDDIENREQ